MEATGPGCMREVLSKLYDHAMQQPSVWQDKKDGFIISPSCLVLACDEDKRARLQSVGTVAALYLLRSDSVPTDINPFLMMGALTCHGEAPVYDPKQIGAINADLGATLADWFPSTKEYLAHGTFIANDEVYAKASTLWAEVMETMMVLFIFQFCR